MISLEPALETLLHYDVHYIATLWRIARVDGVNLYFTDHNESLEFEGNTYTPINSASASAREVQTNLKASNLELRGVIDSDDISDDDIRAGLYRGVVVTEYTIDWRIPWLGAQSTDMYWIDEISWNELRWQAKLSSTPTILRQTFGDIFGRNCRWQLYTAQCGVIEGSFSTTGSVSAVNDQRWVIETNLSGYPDDWFKHGKITFTAGNNDGLTIPIQRSEETNGKLYFADAAPYDIAVSDTFSISPGCERITTPCKDKFNNFDRFGGYPFIPGNDKFVQTP